MGNQWQNVGARKGREETKLFPQKAVYLVYQLSIIGTQTFHFQLQILNIE